MYDKVDRCSLKKTLKAKGFGDKWINCAMMDLRSGTSTVLVDGIEGKKFICKRGMRQGDPISPPFFF